MEERIGALGTTLDGRGAMFTFVDKNSKEIQARAEG